MPNRQVCESQSGLRTEEDDNAGDQVRAPAKKLADSFDAKLKIQLPMGAPTQMALVSSTGELYAFEDTTDASEDE